MYRAAEIRAFPPATEAQRERARVAEQQAEAWLRRLETAGGPTRAEWAKLRARMYAGQVEAQIAGMERLASELRALTPEQGRRRRRQVEEALSRKEHSLGAWTMPPVVFETERYALAEEALRRAWAEQVGLGG